MTSCRLRGRAAGATGGCAFSRSGSASGLPIFAVSSFSMLESLQTGHDSRPRAFWPSKSSAETNQPSNRWRSAQMSSNTITFALLGKHRSEEHTSELQSHSDLVCRLLLEKKNMNILPTIFHSMSMSFSNSILFFIFFVNSVHHAKVFRSFSASFALVLYQIDLLSPLAYI